MGLDPNLEEAMKMAVRETIAFITQRFPKLSREEAYMIASIAVDYHVTQVVDRTGPHQGHPGHDHESDLQRLDRRYRGRTVHGGAGDVSD